MTKYILTCYDGNGMQRVVDVKESVFDSDALEQAQLRFRTAAIAALTLEPGRRRLVTLVEKYDDDTVKILQQASIGQGPMTLDTISIKLEFDYDSQYEYESYLVDADFETEDAPDVYLQSREVDWLQVRLEDVFPNIIPNK